MNKTYWPFGRAAMRTQVEFYNVENGESIVYPNEWKHIPRVGDFIHLYDETAGNDIDGIVKEVNWSIQEYEYSVSVWFEPIKDKGHV